MVLTFDVLSGRSYGTAPAFERAAKPFEANLVIRSIRSNLEEDGAPLDAGFDDTGPFRVSPEPGGVSLETALRDFGPAAIDDLIPRIRTIANALDRAHRAGVVHGALQPSRVFVTDEGTSVIAGSGAHAPFDSAHGKPYVAPEVLDGHGATAQSDQYSLAAITFEWLFGRRITHSGDRPVEVRNMPGVDRPALSKAFTRALALKPADRFASCGAFCDAIAGAIVPELPLLADVDDFKAEDDDAPISASDLTPFDSERDNAFLAQDTPFDSERKDSFLAQDTPIEDAPLAADIKIVAEEANMTAASFETERDNASLAQGRVPSWNPSAVSAPPLRRMETPSFGPLALFLAVIVGAVFGFAAGYMARPRALQSAPPETFADQGVSAPKAPDATAPQAPQAPKALEAPKTAQAPEAPKKSPAPKAPEGPAKPGRLLVRSSPSGASVSVDGVAKGETPIALRDLDMGTRTVTIARPGYIAETRKIAITKTRPARTLDVRLSAGASSAAPRTAAPKPSTPATIGKPAVETGSLSVDSRPTGAAVTVNGKPSGTTPLTINDLAPGEYRILMSMTGYRNFATTVRVVAGERVRAAASLTALEQQ